MLVSIFLFNTKIATYMHACVVENRTFKTNNLNIICFTLCLIEFEIRTSRGKTEIKTKQISLYLCKKACLHTVTVNKKEKSVNCQRT